MAHSPYTLRFATSEDAETIHALITELAIYEREPTAVVATVEDIRRAGFGERRAFEVILAETESQAVGFALFFPVFSTWTGKQGLHLEDLFVQRGHRGRGVGKAIFAALARLAIDRGWERYEWQVLDWNKPAIAFYEAQGARALRRWLPFRLQGATLHRLAQGAPKIEP